jgi:hypothetical protein
MVIAPPDEVGQGKRVAITSSATSDQDTILITGGRLGDVRGNGSR